MCQVFLAGGVLGLFLFLFLEVFDNLGDNGLLLLGSHLGEHEQGVLQEDVLGIYGELIEHVAALLEHLVVGIIVVDQGDSLGVAHLSLVILAPVEVDAAQCQLADGLLYTIAGALFGGEPVVLDSAQGVTVREVQVANGVIDLIEVFLVTVISGHALQRFDLAGDVGALIDGALLDAGVELGAVSRAAAAAGLLIGQVGVALVAHILVELTEQEVHPHLLVALEALDGLGKIGNGLLGLL